MDFVDDINAVFAESDHTATVGAFPPVPVIYAAPFRMAGMFEGQVETSAPACTMSDTDVDALGIQHGTDITIRKGLDAVGDFIVSGTEPDGAGLTRIILTKD